MAKSPSPPRIPKGSKEGGRFLPRWAAELRTDIAAIGKEALQTKENVRTLAKAVHGQDVKNGETSTIVLSAPIQKQIDDLRDRLGTSTPLIIWNIAVLIAIACIAAKVWGYAPY